MRKVISLNGSGHFAVCDDGTVWFWDGGKWFDWGRSPIPQPLGEFAAAADTAASIARQDLTSPHPIIEHLTTGPQAGSPPKNKGKRA